MENARAGRTLYIRELRVKATKKNERPRIAMASLLVEPNSDESKV